MKSTSAVQRPRKTPLQIFARALDECIRMSGPLRQSYRCPDVGDAQIGVIEDAGKHRGHLLPQ